ncbi:MULTISPECIES: serine hydrolase domain-containing protein [Sporosarcina]|uniref:serine hydrolase domain-containing protein n=1 Tax=Sporosarcina TaxID=1569 RepID=UPI00058B1723|nr:MULTISPECIES: serine hydrolase domain-containing protein [Sporosarcina]WJY26372.1 serine hydrolase domain-containing protein [Sporosarcina sp. 0.2-SM1T-5]
MGQMEALDDIIKEHIESGYFSAAVCSISLDGESVYRKAFGVCDLATVEPCRTDTRFDIASITKIFTSTVILHMITERRLTLDTSLGECLPAAKSRPELTSLTIRQLLTHSSGLIAWYPLYTQRGRSFYEVLDSIPLLHESAEKTVYSDLNFMLLGKVIEQLTEMTLEEAVCEYFGNRLDLDSVTYLPLDKHNIAATEFGNRIEKRMCSERHLHFDGWRDEHTAIVGEVNDGNSYYFLNGTAGHAGIFSDADDLVTLGNLYLGVKGFLSDELLQACESRQVGDRGLGWDFGETFPEGFGHTGFTGTALWVVPERQLIVSLLTNRLHSREPQNITPFRKKIFNCILKNV